MLQDLNAPPGALVVMDAGIATEANIQWLRTTGYGYLVVSRERSRQFNADTAIALETAAQETVRCQKVVAEDGQEVRLYCHSSGREQKEQAMAERFASRFETELNALNAGLQRPRTEKRPDKLWERIGRLKEKQHGIGQHYSMPGNRQFSSCRWQSTACSQSHPGGTGANGYLSCFKSEPCTRRCQQNYCLKH